MILSCLPSGFLGEKRNYYIEKLKGNIGVGHVRYSTAGSSVRENAQPLVLNYDKSVCIWNIFQYSCF